MTAQARAVARTAKLGLTVYGCAERSGDVAAHGDAGAEYGRPDGRHDADHHATPGRQQLHVVDHAVVASRVGGVAWEMPRPPRYVGFVMSYRQRFSRPRPRCGREGFEVCR